MKKIFQIIIAIIILLIIGGAVYTMRTQTAIAPHNSEVTEIPETDGPVIFSISPSSGPIGTKVELKGQNFSGFEGDKYAWIENTTTHVKGIIYGNIGSSTEALIPFTLENKYCTADTSYSGLPCPSYLTVTPGVYDLYVIPWGKMSNKVQFTVTK